MTIDPSFVLKIKTSLRIKHTVLDADIEDTIRAALADLQVCGVNIDVVAKDQQDVDALILNAVKLFCKVEQTDDVGKAQEYQRRYDALKTCLMMAEKYREAPANE